MPDKAAAVLVAALLVVAEAVVHNLVQTEILVHLVVRAAVVNQGQSIEQMKQQGFVQPDTADRKTEQG